MGDREKKIFSPEEVSAMLLTKMKETAEVILLAPCRLLFSRRSHQMCALRISLCKFGKIVAQKKCLRYVLCSFFCARLCLREFTKPAFGDSPLWLRCAMPHISSRTPGLSGRKCEARCDHCSRLLQRCSTTSDEGRRDNRRVAGKSN